MVYTSFLGPPSSILLLPHQGASHSITNIVLYLLSFLLLLQGEALTLRMDSWRCIPPGVVAIIMTLPWGGELATINTKLFKEGLDGSSSSVAGAPYIQASRLLGIACGVCLGDMCYHLIILTTAPKGAAKAALGNFLAFTWGHHLTSMLMWPIALYTNSYVYWIAFFLTSEVKNEKRETEGEG